jgi:hypothetical protein
MVEADPALITGIVILTVGGIFLALYLLKKYKEVKMIWDKQNVWPPGYNRCPDYWADLGDKGCQNVHNLGSCPMGKDKRVIANGIQKFASVDNLESRRAACQEAKRCGVTWESVDKLC